MFNFRTYFPYFLWVNNMLGQWFLLSFLCFLSFWAEILHNEGQWSWSSSDIKRPPSKNARKKYVFQVKVRVITLVSNLLGSVRESLGMSKLRMPKVPFRQNISENFLTSLTSILTTVLTSVVKELSKCMSKNWTGVKEMLWQEEMSMLCQSLNIVHVIWNFMVNVQCVCVCAHLCVWGLGGDDEVDSTFSYNSLNHLPFPIHLLLFTHY